jgi:Dna[CI] antecedent, DciA
LGKILPTVVARQRRSATFIEARLRLELASVLGQDLAAGCHALEVRSGTVWITTPDRALAHQLLSDSEELIRRLNRESHLPVRLRRLQVRVGPHPGPEGGGRERRWSG